MRWRCSKCLTRVALEKSGWACSNTDCKLPCEPDRKAIRLALDLAKIAAQRKCESCGTTRWVDDWEHGSKKDCPVCVRGYSSYVEGDLYMESHWENTVDGTERWIDELGFSC